MRSRFMVLFMLVGVAAHAAAQTGFPRDTVSPRYARWHDELPAMLEAMASVVDTGLGPSTRGYLVREFATLRPPKPFERGEYARSRTYLVTTAFRGREALLSFFVYWYDTSTVALRYRSPNPQLELAIDSALFERRLAGLAPVGKIRLTVAELDPYNNAQPGLSYAMAALDKSRCSGSGFERRMRWVGDTLLVQVLGVPVSAVCPNTAGLASGGSYWAPRPAGTYHFVFDSHGDTNVAVLELTDTSMSLRPVSTTYLQIDETVHWRYPSMSLVLRCNREAGDPRLCDALHEFVLTQRDIRPYRFPASGVSPLNSQFEAGRQMVYRYSDEATAMKVRRCFASIPPQTRLDSWVRLLGRPGDNGRWWGETPSGGSNSSTASRSASILDADGNVPSTCGDSALAVVSETRTSTGVSKTHIHTFEFQRTNATSIDARSDGWITLTPVPWRGQPLTTRLFARADDALRWVQRVRDVLGGNNQDVNDGGGSKRFIPSLGRGRAHVTVHVTDSVGYTHVSFGFNECGGVNAQFNVNAMALLSIAADVERAALIARRQSPAPILPSSQRAYDAEDVSCGVVLLNDSTAARRAPASNSVTTLAQFVVDTTGRVEPSSLKLSSVRPRALTDAVRTQLLNRRYRPAELAGVRVRQLMRLERVVVSVP